MVFQRRFLKLALCLAVFFLPGIASADFLNCGNCKKWINGKLVRIGNVKIEVYENGKLIGRGFTNANGNYCIRCFTSSIRNTPNMYEVFSKNGHMKKYNWLHICDLPVNATNKEIERATNVHTTNIESWYPGR